ncbi:hypothetical protein [Croceicoccus sp. YJ47]|uniref:hypothetical protein n=1 Tax=Croceicoccus sp. YJ47 TaxID=2798724 RepID=UPI0019226501|nr:hypothetical protein [Croceicoccus sp. YJ47]QQN74414.1 hypothetical protein JD971_01025 [Croceicoccus sp. YJ47]
MFDLLPSSRLNAKTYGGLCMIRSVFFAAIVTYAISTPVMAQEAGADAYRQNCGAIPYSAGEALSEVELTGRLGGNVLDKLVDLPDLTVFGGQRVTRSAFAGLRQQAMGAVLDAYACRISAEIRARGGESEQEQLRLLGAAVANLNLEISTLAGLPDEDFRTRLAAKDYYQEQTTRKPTDPTIDRAIVDAALNGLDTNKLFINITERQRWLGLNFAGVAELQGCQTIIKAALSDGSSSLQRSLADLRSILTNYLDANIAPVVSLAVLANTLSGNPAGATAVSSSSLSACAAAVQQSEINLSSKIQAIGSDIPPATDAPSPSVPATTQTE